MYINDESASVITAGLWGSGNRQHRAGRQQQHDSSGFDPLWHGTLPSV